VDNFAFDFFIFLVLVSIAKWINGLEKGIHNKRAVIYIDEFFLWMS